MTLSNGQMLAAVFANACDKDPDFPNGLQAIRGRADIHYVDDNEIDFEATNDGIKKDVEMYELGKETLGTHMLTYSKRTTVPYSVDSKPMVEIPDGASFIVVNSGHIATSPAYRFAIFKECS